LFEEVEDDNQGEGGKYRWSANLDDAYVDDLLKSFEELVVEIRAEEGEKLKKLVDQIVDLVRRIKESKKGPLAPKAINDLHAEALICDKEATILQSQEKVRARTSQFHKPGPKSPTAVQGGKGLVGAAIQRAHIKVEVARVELQSLREVKHRATKFQLKVQMELLKSMKDLASFEHIAANSEKMLEIIVEAIADLGELKKLWRNLTAFFQSMANLIKAAMSPRLVQFSEEVDAIKEVPHAVKREFIYQTAYNAAKVAHCVNQLADSYYVISGTHLLPLSMKLDKLIGLDKDDDKEEIQTERESLGIEATKAQESIVNIIKSKEIAFDKAVIERMQGLDNELNELPAIEPAKKAEIKKRAKESVEEVKESFDDFV